MRIFNEIQKLPQWLLYLANLLLLSLLIYSCYNWYVLDQAYGNVKSDNYTVQILVILSCSLCMILLFTSRLETCIDEIGIHHQFIPFNLSKKTIRWNELKKCYVRSYNPITKYGGWGYRIFSGNSRAMNISGNMGIQLEGKKSWKLLIGTQKQEDAQKVIYRYFKNNHE